MLCKGDYLWNRWKIELFGRNNEWRRYKKEDDLRMNFRVALFLWAVFEELHGVHSRAQDYYLQYILKAVELLWN